MSTGNFGTGAWDDGGWQAAKASQLPCGNPSGRADQFNSVLRRHFGSKEGTIAQPAQKRPLAEDDVVKQLKRPAAHSTGQMIFP